MKTRFVGCVLALVASLSAACSDPEATKKAHFEKGNELFAQKKYQDAILEYRNAVRIDPRFGEARTRVRSGAYPRWTKAGAELVYRTTGGIMAAPVETSGDSFQSGAPRRLFTGEFVGGIEGVQIDQFVFADYEVAADGSRFLMFPTPSDETSERRRLITLVTNWFAELTQRAGPR